MYKIAYNIGVVNWALGGRPRLLMFTKHPATNGLGNIPVKKGKNVKEIYLKGLVSHGCLAVSTKKRALTRMALS